MILYRFLFFGEFFDDPFQPMFTVSFAYCISDYRPLAPRSAVAEVKFVVWWCRGWSWHFALAGQGPFARLPCCRYLIAFRLCEQAAFKILLKWRDLLLMSVSSDGIANVSYVLGVSFPTWRLTHFWGSGATLVLTSTSVCVLLQGPVPI